MNQNFRNVSDIFRYLKEGRTERNEKQAEESVCVCGMYFVFFSTHGSKVWGQYVF